MTDQRAPSTERRPEPEYCDDPEVVNFSRTDAAPRPVTSEIYPQDKIYVASSTQDSPGSSPAITGSGLETSPLNEEKQVVEEKAPSTPWWRRKKIVWIVGIVVFLVLVGLIVGLVVALVVNKKDDESSSSELAHIVTCNETLCPQVLSVAEFDDDFHIFARNSDNEIVYKVGHTDTLDSSWKTLYQPPGRMVSQPAAITWAPIDNITRLEVMTVVEGGTVWASHITDGSWTDWEAMGPYTDSQLVFCKSNYNRLDVWALDQLSHNVTHTYWLRGNEERWANRAGQWGIVAEGGPAKGAPGAECRELQETTIVHDLVYYDREEAKVYHMSYFRRTGKWGRKKSWDGAWMGDPVLISLNNQTDRVDFFGIQENRRMYHFGKYNEYNYTEMEDLGGSFASVPSVVAPDDGEIDLVALGMDGRLVHNHFDGDEWFDEWETLDIESASAPKAVVKDDTVVVFYISRAGEMVVSSIEPDDDGRWTVGEITTNVLGGNLTNGYYGDDLDL